MKQELRLELALYQEDVEETTVRMALEKSDCLARAHESARAEAHEQEAYWLLMAAAL